MRVMSEEQEKLLRMLVDLAEGDAALVQRALVKAPEKKESPLIEQGAIVGLDDVIKYILANKGDREGGEKGVSNSAAAV